MRNYVLKTSPTQSFPQKRESTAEVLRRTGHKVHGPGAKCGLLLEPPAAVGAPRQEKLNPETANKGRREQPAMNDPILVFIGWLVEIVLGIVILNRFLAAVRYLRDIRDQLCGEPPINPKQSYFCENCGHLLKNHEMDSAGQLGRCCIKNCECRHG
jgi:hypothetical protein